MYSVRVNRLRVSPAELQQRLEDNGVECEPSPFLPDDFLRVDAVLCHVLDLPVDCQMPVATSFCNHKQRSDVLVPDVFLTCVPVIWVMFTQSCTELPRALS